MTSLIKETSQFQLTPQVLESALEQIKEKLTGRVMAAYIFGSAATGEHTVESDMDLILIVSKADRPFVQRGFDFLDLFDVYPKIDLLVYTQAEFDQQLADSEIGFWKSVRETLKRII